MCVGNTNPGADLGKLNLFLDFEFAAELFEFLTYTLECLHCFGLFDETCSFALEQRLGGSCLGSTGLLDGNRVGFLDSDLGQAFLFECDGVRFLDLHLGESVGRCLCLLTFGHTSHRTGLEVGCFQVGLGHGDAFGSKTARCSFLGFGLLDVLDELALCFGLGHDDRCLALAVRLFDDSQRLDGFFLLGHGLLDRDTVTLDVGDLGALTLEFLLGGSCFDSTRDRFELFRLGHALGLDRNDSLAVLGRNFDFAKQVLFGHANFLVGGQTCPFGPQAFF